MNEQQQIPRTAVAAREKLASIVQHGIENTAPVVERIMSQVPTDSLVRGEAVDFAVGNDGVSMSAGDQTWCFHDNATTQLCGRLGIPVSYARALSAPQAETWQFELLRHNLRESTRNRKDRYLVRAVDGQARAVLSDRFRRLDTRPLLDSFIGALAARGKSRSVARAIANV